MVHLALHCFRSPGPLLPGHRLRTRWTGWGRYLVLAAVLLVGTGCERRAGRGALTAADDPNAPEQETWGAHYYVSEEGRPHLEMFAPYMAQYSRPDSAWLWLTGVPGPPDSSRVRVQLYDASGQVTTTLTADEVLYFDRERRFQARGGVLVVTRTGRRLESEDLHWREDTRQVRTQGFAHITTPQEELQGYDLVADENLTSYQLSRVTGIVTYSEE